MDFLYKSMFAVYSEDFQRFAEITGVDEAYLFAKTHGVLDLTVARRGKMLKSSGLLIDFFGDEIFKKLQVEFGGGGRIRIPTGKMIAAKMKAAEISERFKNGEKRTELAKEFNYTSRNVAMIIQNWGFKNESSK